MLLSIGFILLVFSCYVIVKGIVNVNLFLVIWLKYNHIVLRDWQCEAEHHLTFLFVDGYFGSEG
jgi:hypothetical protein